MSNGIGIVLRGSLFPSSVDDHNVNHDAAIVIFSDNYELILELNRNREIEGNCRPLYAGELTLEKTIELRDGLNKLIDCINKDITQ